MLCLRLVLHADLTILYSFSSLFPFNVNTFFSTRVSPAVVGSSSFLCTRSLVFASTIIVLILGSYYTGQYATTNNRGPRCIVTKKELHCDVGGKTTVRTPAHTNLQYCTTRTVYYMGLRVARVPVSVYLRGMVEAHRQSQLRLLYVGRRMHM
jgi:hypothetical protein